MCVAAPPSNQFARLPSCDDMLIENDASEHHLEIRGGTSSPPPPRVFMSTASILSAVCICAAAPPSEQATMKIGGHKPLNSIGHCADVINYVKATLKRWASSPSRIEGSAHAAAAGVTPAAAARATARRVSLNFSTVRGCLAVESSPPRGSRRLGKSTFHHHRTAGPPHSSPQRIQQRRPSSRDWVNV